ncbi:AIM24 family protein [Rhodococcus kroppenstedtii]|uniref:AIM24 family protein n=1 Tax=Rhodococcoides kroppenstedtii TaxID=293050 RepID=UPI0029551206|nr:AIM24 family protein [Rhodococcus kroppenstedtii]MDV7196092.1 AIM24 family protein [Rhodococcus kroppenstedtii]
MADVQSLARGENRPAPLDASGSITVSVTGAAVDVSALLLTAAGRVRSDQDLVFFNNPVGPGVRYAPDGVTVDTRGVPAEVETIAITASLDGSGPATFGGVPLRATVGPDLDFPMTGLTTETAVVGVEIYRRGDGWKVRAVGQGYDDGLAGIATAFGITVDEPAAAPPPQPAAAPPPQPAAAPPPQPTPSQAAHPQPTPPVRQEGLAVRSELFAPSNAEVQGNGILKQGSKMARVAMNGEVMARSGSMVAYQGDLRFEAQGSGGIGNMIRRTVTGEGVPLMKVSGHGDLFLANAAQDVHIIDLDGSDGLTINGSNVLAFDTSLSYRIGRVQGAAASSNAGLFNCVFTGRGRIAITTDGQPVVLTVDQPTFADPQAAVAWSSSLQTSVKSNDQLNFGTLIGRSTGERFTLQFSGQGFVVVQPSELPPGGLIAGTGGGQQAGVGGALGGLLGR